MLEDDIAARRPGLDRDLALAEFDRTAKRRCQLFAELEARRASELSALATIMTELQQVEDRIRAAEAEVRGPD